MGLRRSNNGEVPTIVPPSATRTSWFIDDYEQWPETPSKVNGKWFIYIKRIGKIPVECTHLANSMKWQKAKEQWKWLFPDAILEPLSQPIIGYIVCLGVGVYLLTQVGYDFSWLQRTSEETSRITPKNQNEVVNHLLTPMTKTHPNDFMLSPHFPPKHAVVVSCLCFFLVKALVSEVWIKISRCITWCLKFIGGMDFVCEVKGLWLGIHGKVPTEPSQNDLKWPESLTSVTNFFLGHYCLFCF